MTRQLALKFRLDDHTRLDDYVGEAGSKLVHLSGFIYLSGSKGSGKSHLLQGICHRAVSEGLSTLYLPALSILEPGVLEGLEQVDLICLDDIDDVLELADWQRALFHLINVVKDAGNTLIASSTHPVSALKLELGDLDSRIKGAYLLSTDLLDDEQKLEVMKGMIEAQIDVESHAFFASARVWDDGVIDPRHTRAILGISLSAAYNRAVKGTTSFGVYRH